MLPPQHIISHFSEMNHLYEDVSVNVSKNVRKILDNSVKLRLNKLVKIFKSYWFELNKVYHVKTKWTVQTETKYFDVAEKFKQMSDLINQILFEIRMMNL